MISSIWAQRTKWTLTRALIGGAQPMEGWWAPVAQPHKREVRTSDTTDEVRCRHCSPPQNPNPIREGGLQRREAPPRHHRSAVTTTSSLRVAALAQILTDVPAVAPGERK